MQNRPTAQSIYSVNARANNRASNRIAATCPLSNQAPSDWSQSSGKKADEKKAHKKKAHEKKADEKRSDWKRKGAIAGAAVTSAGIVLPLASDRAIAYEGPRSLASSPIDMAQRLSAGAQTVQLMASALKPQAFAAEQVTFSSQTQAASANAFSAKLATLLSRAQDGSLTLSYQPPRDANPVQAQAVLAELVDATKAKAAGNQTQLAPSSKTSSSAPYKVAQIQQPAVDLAINSTADSKLFAARQQVQQVQQKIASFEAERGQQDMAAYRNVLSSRMAEIAEQGTRLVANIERNQRLLAQLKMRLLTVNADVSLPERVLAADEEYQAVWARLQKAEQNILEEFSAANIDGTRLNEIYGDYKYHQQWLARAAEQAFPNYVMSNEEAEVGFIAQAPTAIDLMQNLVVATHQDRVQQLRQETLDIISQRLSGRQAQLAADIGTYEQLQRELSAATETVSQYENQQTQRANATRKQLTGQLVANADVSTADVSTADVSSASVASTGTSTPIAPTGAPTAEADKSPVTQAHLLAPFFPQGTLSRTLLGVAIAAGALATAATAHRANKKQHTSGIEPLVPTSTTPAEPMLEPTLEPVLEPVLEPLEDFNISPAAVSTAPATDFSSFSLYGESVSNNSQLIEEDLLDTVLSSVEPESAPAISTDELVAELLEITRGDETLAAYQPRPIAETHGIEADRSEVNRSEEALASELSAIVSEAANTQPRAMPALTAEAVEEILGVEVVVKELEEIMNAPGPALTPSQRLSTKTAAITDPIKLSVKEVDLFAEQVIRWVLNDLGFQVVNSSNMAAES